CGALTLAAASGKAGQGVALLRQGQTAAGIAAVEQAAAYNPLQGDYNFLMAQIRQAQGDHDAALAEIERAIRKSRYNPAYYELRAHIHHARGEYGAAVAGAEEAVAKAPLNRDRYESLVRIYFLAGYGELGSGNEAAARGYFQAALAVPERMAAITEGLTETRARLWSGKRLTVTRDMQLPLGASRYFLGDFDAAAAALEEAAQTKDEAARGEALAWLAAVAGARGETERAEELLAEAGELNPEAAQLYAQIGGLPVLAAEEEEGEGEEV
ncbi:MAG: hypothetical protein IBX71_10675, partial [Candidatus Desulforudis sp.]|nr:hypothetical protein [Desulforudis sp.]